MITEVHQQGRFYRLSTVRAAHYENLKPHVPSPEDWCCEVFLERDQAWSDLSMLRVEYLQEQRGRENEANCEKLKSEMQKLQRRQRELARQKEKRIQSREPAATASRPESQMEVDEAPRPSGRFNLDRAAQEHMIEGLEVWIPPEPLPSVHSLDMQSVRPLMEVRPQFNHKQQPSWVGFITSQGTTREGAVESP